jgi:hypothetical protein
MHKFEVVMDAAAFDEGALPSMDQLVEVGG